MKNILQRRSEALVRNQEHNSLTIKQKLTKIDLRFGAGVGGTKERQRLGLQALKLENDKGVAVPGSGNQRPKKENYQKPKRS